MKADDPHLKRMQPPRLNLLEQTYLPQIIEGLAITGKHILKSVAGDVFTTQYPEEQHVPPANYRGVHRLNKEENGRIKCVACMLCATACPAHCIDIVGETAPDTWDDREKYPRSFVIDELRCIYCGMCEEACPVDAIELTTLYDITGLSREQMIFDKAKLLSVFDVTKDAEPMRTANPLAAAGGSGPVEGEDRTPQVTRTVPTAPTDGPIVASPRARPAREAESNRAESNP